jgi:xanthine/uracil permease
MEESMRESGTLTLSMVKVLIILLMGRFTKVISKMMSVMVAVFYSIQMGNDMRAHGVTARKTVKEPIFSRMIRFIASSIKMVKNRTKDSLLTEV